MVLHQLAQSGFLPEFLKSDLLDLPHTLAGDSKQLTRILQRQRLILAVAEQEIDDLLLSWRQELFKVSGQFERHGLLVQVLIHRLSVNWIHQTDIADRHGAFFGAIVARVRRLVETNHRLQQTQQSIALDL